MTRFSRQPPGISPFETPSPHSPAYPSLACVNRCLHNRRQICPALELSGAPLTGELGQSSVICVRPALYERPAYSTYRLVLSCIVLRE